MALLYVRVIKETEEFIINSISLDKNSWYLIPEEVNHVSNHKILLNKPTIKNAMAAIKIVKGYRTVGIKFDDEIKKEYTDEAGNVCFRDMPLEEYIPMSISEAQQLELVNRIKHLEYKLISKQEETNVREIEKKFVLEKFQKNKSEPTEWLHRFEQECSRFEVNSDSYKIQALRFFLSGPAEDWYGISIKKIGINDWETWKRSFLNVFVDKGWQVVRKAFNYKYLGGSLVDYALIKERLCLEVEPEGTALSRINQIVFGLPDNAQGKIDREKIRTLDDLYTELRKLEDAFSRKKNEVVSPRLKKKESSQEPYKTELQRRPCSICTALGFTNRYHLVSECRNQNKISQKPKSKITETSTEIRDLKFDLNTQNLN